MRSLHIRTHANASETVESASQGEVEQQEDTSSYMYKLVTFYWLTDIEDPDGLVEAHRDFMKSRDCKGRIYINKQGINAQLSGMGTDAVDYAEFVMSDSRFKGCSWSVFPVKDHQFPRLALRFKPNLVSFEGGTQHLPLTDSTQRATKIKPLEFRSKIQEALGGAKPYVLLDVRNDYEWDAGHFLGAERPSNQRFRDTQLDAPGEPLHGVSKDTPILMYCTGGIRCDVYSTVLRDRGFKEMYTIEGGVQAYLRDVGKENWDGELFVFDDRLATPNMPQDPEGEGMKAHVGDRPCFCCRQPVAAPPHRNCANVDCNRLFLVCANCLQEHTAHCSAECLECSTRQRPLTLNRGDTGRYNKWHEYAAETVSVRGGGRGRRRQQKRERTKAREMELALAAVKNGDFQSEEIANSRHSRRRMERRVEAARLLMEAGELPSDVDVQSLKEAIVAMYERQQKSQAA